MIIGVPKELKSNENRVAITPAGVGSLVKGGHRVLVENDAGTGSGFKDADYLGAGAVVVHRAKDVWEQSEMIMKVKEPIADEYRYFRPDVILFTYLHLAAEPHLAKALIDGGVTAIAYETVARNNKLPLLTPMSEVAGRMATQIGARCLENNFGGKGIILSGVPGVHRGKVTIIGGGIVGTNAAQIALGLGADVTIIDINPDRLREIEDVFGSRIQTLISNPTNIAEEVAASDLVIGAVLIPGGKAPKLVTTEMIKSMNPGSVVIDVAIDQGGVIETVDRITTHAFPTYEKHGVIHYAVANIPSVVPRTSTLALTNVTLPYAVKMANYGFERALQLDPSLKKGVNTAKGAVTHETVAADLGFPYVPVDQLNIASI